MNDSLTCPEEELGGDGLAEMSWDFSLADWGVDGSSTLGVLGLLVFSTLDLGVVIGNSSLGVFCFVCFSVVTCNWERGNGVTTGVGVEELFSFSLGGLVFVLSAAAENCSDPLDNENVTDLLRFSLVIDLNC